MLNGGTGSNVGTLALGGTSSIVLAIKNVGNSNLTGLAISKSGANAADFQTSSLILKELAGNESTSIQVYFTPSALGNRTALIRIASNDGDENPFDVQLTGMGVTK